MSQSIVLTGANRGLGLERSDRPPALCDTLQSELADRVGVGARMSLEFSVVVPPQDHGDSAQATHPFTDQARSTSTMMCRAVSR